MPEAEEVFGAGRGESREEMRLFGWSPAAEARSMATRWEVLGAWRDSKTGDHEYEL
jgi:hypothetical protein